MTDRKPPRYAKWKFCPACDSYRFTWDEQAGDGECQDCGALVRGRKLVT